MGDTKWRGPMILLLYTLNFVRSWEDQYAKTLHMVKTGAGIIYSPEEMKFAIEEALRSSEDLQAWGRLPHSDEVLRDFFSRILQGLSN